MKCINAYILDDSKRRTTLIKQANGKDHEKERTSFFFFEKNEKERTSFFWRKMKKRGLPEV